MSNAIQIKDIANRIGMQPGSINAAGHSLSDSISFDAAIQFVEQRIYPKGRWTADKAGRAKDYLIELVESRKTEVIEPVKSEVPEAQPTVKVKENTVSVEAKPTLDTWQKWGLIGLVAAPTAASVHNMHTVSATITGNGFDALCLTAVLSITGVGFVLAGVRSWYSMVVTVFLIVYESFCNLVRVYAGLYSPTGNAGKFLGTVTEIFGSGTSGTAILLGGFIAVFIAAVQYVGIFELKNRM